MFKRNISLISKLLAIIVCTSLVTPTFAFASVSLGTQVSEIQQDTTLNYSGDNGDWIYNGSYDSLNGFMLNGIRFYVYESNNSCRIDQSYNEIAGTLNIPSNIIVNGNKYQINSISEYAFRDCTNLKNVSIPMGVSYIPQGAFMYCSNLNTIVVPSSITKELWGQNSAFANCSSLEKIEVNQDNPIYKSIDGVLYNKSGTKIVVYPAAKEGENYIIPDNVVSITEKTFIDCKNLKNITMSDNVIEINNSAFSGCSQLETVKMPSNIKSIKYNLFDGCSNLKNIIIPSNVTTIYEAAFRGCSSLTNISIPNKVTKIDHYAFQGCSNLTHITIPNSVTEISDMAFKDCSNLTAVVIPDSVTKIGTDAFANCNKSNLIFQVPNNDVRLLLINANVDSNKIRIVSGSPNATKVSSIGLDTVTSNWTIGKTGIFSATILPSDATDSTVTWTSSDPNIATVDDGGIVTAKAKGTVTITATANDGSGVSQSKTITVNDQNSTNSTTSTDVKITQITIDGNSSITTIGGIISLTPNILPNTATNKSVTWTSSNPSVANVNNQGVITAISNGNAIITVTANDGSNITSTKTITVTGQTSNNISNSDLKSVSISGKEEVHHKLKASVKYSGTKPNLEYQWQRSSKKDGDYSDISDATEDEYKLKNIDKNKYIKLIVSATINGITYKENDIAGKIDSDTSNNDDNNTSTSNSNSSTNNNSNNSNNYNNNIIALRPLNVMNASSNNLGSNNVSPTKRMFVNPAGHTITGWIKLADNWYYVEKNGLPKTGWFNYNDKWYYFDQSGVMVKSASIGGYLLGGDGAMIQ